MRTIVKRAPPKALTTWRNQRLSNHNLPEAERVPGMECDYPSLRNDATVREAVEDSLHSEQGGLCAYTGITLRLRPADPATHLPREVCFHLEHLKPQVHCNQGATAVYGQDTAHDNLVACWPYPNYSTAVPYGAQKKGDWPGPGEEHLFLSPLLPSCSDRFRFNRRGEIRPARPDDTVAARTISALGLDHRGLVALRQAAILDYLHPKGAQLKLNEARRLHQQLLRQMQDLDHGLPVRLPPFCFAIVPALEREIRKLEGIHASRK